MHEWLHTVRMWLWRRQVRMLERSLRPAGTTEMDWIGATTSSTAANNDTGWGGAGR